MFEIDEIAIPTEMWQRLDDKEQSVAAAEEIKKMLSGMVLYSHALSLDPNIKYTLVTLRELDTAIPWLRMIVTVGFD